MIDELDEKYILLKALDNGIIDVKSLSVKIEEMERKNYLATHPFKIWENNKGHFLTYVKDESKPNQRRLVNKRSRKELEKWLHEYYHSLECEPTVKQCFNMWLDDKLKYGEISETTYYKYKSTYDRFFKDENIARRKIKYVDALDIEHFVKSAIHDNELTSKGWANLRTILYGMFKYAKRNEYTDLSITYVINEIDLGRRIFRHRVMYDEEQVFDEEEVEKIYDYVFNKVKEPTILMLGVILAFQTGLRVGEISTLKYSDLTGDVLYVQRTESKVRRNNKWAFIVTEHTKGRDGERKIVMTEGAKKTLRMARMMTMDSEWLFSKNGKRIESKQYTRCLYRICDQIGIPHRSMHKARKTYATTLLDAGVSPRIIMNQMGHTMIETTKAYYHFNNKNVEQVKEILSDSLII